MNTKDLIKEEDVEYLDRYSQYYLRGYRDGRVEGVAIIASLLRTVLKAESLEKKIETFERGIKSL